MKALGQEHPVAADGNLRIYNAPYDADLCPTLIINTETNLWRDTKSSAYGNFYDLAYELTGSCNMSELNLYITGQIDHFVPYGDKITKDETVVLRFEIKPEGNYANTLYTIRHFIV